MNLTNLANIPLDQLDLLINVFYQLRERARVRRTREENFLLDHLFSKQPSDQLLIVRGVHYNQWDRTGLYHFNVQIKDRGMVSPTVYHIYVEPTAVTNPQPIVVDEQGSVTLDYYQRMIYSYHQTTNY